MPTRIIRTEYDLEMLGRFLRTQKLPLTVSIMKGERRSSQQNRLQRLWCREIAEQLQDRTEERVRGEIKLNFGVPILRAEDEAFRQVFDEKVAPYTYEEKVNFMMEPWSFPVTSIMTTKQKTQFLDDVFRFFSEQGLVLTQPDELGRAA